MRLAFTAALGVALMLGGCVNLSRSAAVAPLPEDAARDGRVTEITLDKGGLNTSAEFDGLFRHRGQTKLDGCARGGRALRLEAGLERLDKANPLLVAAVGGFNVLRGTARLVDVATGEPVGEYRIGRTVMGGRLSIVQMLQAEEQLSDAFGQELCDQAFAAQKQNR